MSVLEKNFSLQYLYNIKQTQTAKKQTPTAFTKLKHGKKRHKRKTSIYNSTDPHCFQTTSLIPIPICTEPVHP